MKQTLLVILWGLIATVGLAQSADHSDEFHLDSNQHHSIAVAGSYFFASTAITNGLASDYYLHRFIENSTKDEVGNKLQRSNCFGTGFNGSITYLYRPDSCKYHYIFTLQQNFFATSEFRDDVFDLYFRGNKGFSGDTAFVDHSDFRSIQYYQTGIGVSGTCQAGRTEWYAIGNLFLGHDFLDIKTGNGYLYTSPDGEYIDADLDITFRASDSTAVQPGAVNGTGFGLTAGFSTTLSSHTRIHAGVTNLGFIHFFERSSYAQLDSTLRFEGLDATELFDFSDTVTSTIINDSAIVQQFLSNRSKEGFNVWVPGHFDLSLDRELNSSLTLSIGTRQYFAYHAVPIGWLEASYRLYNHHTIRLHTQYGGFTAWSAGIGYQLNYLGWELSISSNYLSAWMSRNGRSQGAFVSLSKSF